MTKIDIAVLLGSQNDYDNIVRDSAMPKVFKAIGVKARYVGCSCHRNEDQLREVCQLQIDDGAKLFIGIAGMSAGLPGMISAVTKGRFLVLGGPLANPEVPGGMDSLLAMLTLPPGSVVGVAGVAYNDVMLKNTAILACQALLGWFPVLTDSLASYLEAERQKKPVIPNLEEV